MGSDNQVELVALEEVFYDVGTKREGHATVILTPAVDVCVGVSPHKVAEEACVRNIRRSDNSSDLLQTAEVG